jgi:hypothetical protein
MRGNSARAGSSGFHGHRDVVGSGHMHPIAYGETIAFPQRITYRRPGPVQGSGDGIKSRLRSQEPARCSRPDTGHGRRLPRYQGGVRRSTARRGFALRRGLARGRPH